MPIGSLDDNARATRLAGTQTIGTALGVIEIYCCSTGKTPVEIPEVFCPPAA